MAIIKMIITFLMSLSQVFAPIGAVVESGEAAYFTDWTLEEVFDEDDYIELEKTPGEDFVVLNLADIQLSDENVFADEGTYSLELITKLVEAHDPDLITLSGDNAWGPVSYMEVVSWIDSFGIPWAPVMGNHDGEGCISEFWAAYQLYEAENCLFEFGPKDMGYGNYIINVTENDKIVHTFFMMDTHDSAEYTLEDGTYIDGYDHLWENQLLWYEWAVNGIEDLAGRKVESTVIMHIPVQEYIDAWEMVSITNEDGTSKINPAFASIATGQKGEDCCPGAVNNGFFALVKELGSTKTILVGHDHRNDFVVDYQGIKLAYGVKTGFGSYWSPDRIGGTTIKINSKGNAKLTQHYYDLELCGWDITDD